MGNKKYDWRDDPGIRKAFKQMGPVKGAREVMIHVMWSGVNGPHDHDAGHSSRRGSVIADLGLDEYPEHGLTDEDMQHVARAAKFAAIKRLRLHKKARAK